MDADMIINPTPGIAAAQYDALNTRPAHYLLGPTQPLLRQQFPARRAERLPSAGGQHAH